MWLIQRLTVVPHIKQCNRTRTGMRADRGTDISDHKIFISKTFFNQIGNKLCIFRAVTGPTPQNDSIGKRAMKSIA